MSTTPQEEGEKAPMPDDILDQPRESVPPDGQEEEADEGLDPRVKDELDRLNVASENINKYEKAIGDAREQFKAVTDEAFAALNRVKKSKERSIAKARPYFEMRKRARRAHIEAQRFAQRYEKAVSMHKASRETVAKAEANVLAGKSNQLATGIVGQDAMAWMEVLNHATLKVMDTEKDRRDWEEEHLKASARYSEFERSIHVLYKDNKRSIKNAMPYFEQHAKYYLQLESLKKGIESLEKSILDAKSQYSSALSNLERISNEIHESRDRNVSHLAAREAIEGASLSPDCGSPGERTDGVGAEEVNVDAVLEEMTNLTYQYTASMGSLDDDDDERADGTLSPSVLARLARLDMAETSSLTTTTSRDAESDADSHSHGSDVLANGLSCPGQSNGAQAEDTVVDATAGIDIADDVQDQAAGVVGDDDLQRPSEREQPSESDLADQQLPHDVDTDAAGVRLGTNLADELRMADGAGNGEESIEDSS